MVPIPSPNPEPNHAIPSLHLQCLNLSSLGACRFFSFTSSPNSLLSNSCTKVLNALYPLGLQSPVNDPSNACSPLIRSITMHLRSFGGVAHTMGSDLDNEHKEVCLLFFDFNTILLHSRSNQYTLSDYKSFGMPSYTY